MLTTAMLIMLAGLAAAPDGGTVAPEAELKRIVYHPTLNAREQDALQRQCLPEGQANVARVQQEQAAAGEPATPAEAFQRGKAIGAGLAEGIISCLVKNGYQTIWLTPDELSTYRKIKNPSKKTDWLVELAKQKASAAPASPGSE